MLHKSRIQSIYKFFVTKKIKHNGYIFGFYSIIEQFCYYMIKLRTLLQTYIYSSILKTYDQKKPITN